MTTCHLYLRILAALALSSLPWNLQVSAETASVSRPAAKIPLTADVMLNKNNAMQHFQLGKNLQQRKLYQGAIVEFQKALALDPAWREAKLALIWAKRDWELSKQTEAQRHTSLPELVQKAQTYYERGKRLEDENNLLEAALAYKDAVDTLSDYPEANAALSRVQDKAKMHLGPKRNVSPVEPVRPSSSEVNAMLEPMPSKSRLPKSILRNRALRFSKPPALQAAPDNKVTQAIQTHFLNGSQALDCGDYAGAIQEFELILEFSPDNKKALYKLQQAKQKRQEELALAQRQAEEAAAAGDTAGKLKALRNMAVMDPTNRALQENWHKAQKENPEMVEKLYRAGVELYAQGEYQEALQNWELVLDMNPNHKKSQESIKAVREKLLLISNQKQ